MLQLISIQLLFKTPMKWIPKRRTDRPLGLLLTSDEEVHGAPVLAGNEGVLAGVAPVGLGDGKTVQFPDGDVVEPLLCR